MVLKSQSRNDVKMKKKKTSILYTLRHLKGLFAQMMYFFTSLCHADCFVFSSTRKVNGIEPNCMDGCHQKEVRKYSFDPLNVV